MAAIETKSKPVAVDTTIRTLEQFLAQQREIDLLRFITCERQSRAIDADSAAAMENRKREGYF